MTDISPEKVAETAARLRDKTKMKYAADCKCGQCAIVPLSDVAEAADMLEALAARLAEVEAERDRQYDENVNRIYQERQQELRAEAAEAEVARLRTAQGAAGVLLENLEAQGVLVRAQLLHPATAAPAALKSRFARLRSGLRALAGEQQ
jgi:hypothetical protein